MSRNNTPKETGIFMNVPCVSEHTDGSRNEFSIEKPAGALPDSLLTALSAIRVAETGNVHKVERIGIRGGPMMTRQQIMDQAKTSCPHRVF